MPKKQTIVQQHKANFETLRRAFENDDVCLLDCQEVSTGESVAVIAAAMKGENGEVQLVPFAMFFNGNPYEMVRPPDPAQPGKYLPAEVEGN